jgi:hypothetical protein
MDLNISHYSDQELIQLLNLDVVTEESVRSTIRAQLSRHPENQALQTFFNAIQERLLDNLKTRSVNPDQKNIISRIIHVDSSHVPLYVENFTSDKFLFQLSDPIPNVTSISLLSVEIPQSWYTFSSLKGNTSCVYYYYTPTYTIYPYDVHGRPYYKDITVDGVAVNDLDNNLLVSGDYLLDANGHVIPTIVSNPVYQYTITDEGYLKDHSGNTITTAYQIDTDAYGVELYLTDNQSNILYHVTTQEVFGLDEDGSVILLRDENGALRTHVDESGNPVRTRRNVTNQGAYVDYMDAAGNLVFHVNHHGAVQNLDSIYSEQGIVLEKTAYRKHPLKLRVARYGDVTFTNAENVTTKIDNIYTFIVKENTFAVTIPDGNYTIKTLLATLKRLLRQGVDGLADTTFDYTIVKHSGRVIFSSTFSFKIFWHDSTGAITLLNLTYTNHHLGYYVGFTTDITYASVLDAADAESPYVRAGRNMPSTDDTIMYHTGFSPSILNVNGTRYVTLELNDFSSNRISNNIVLMNALPRHKVVLPEVLKADLPQVLTGFNTTAILGGNKNIRAAQLNLVNNYTVPPPPGRQLIARQASNLFAKIPLKRNAFLVYNPLSSDENKDEVPEVGYARHFCELAGSMQSNVREYLGPITLSSLEVGLYDDKGFLLGLNGMHWSCSIVVKSVYQKKEKK